MKFPFAILPAILFVGCASQEDVAIPADVENAKIVLSADYMDFSQTSGRNSSGQHIDDFVCSGKGVALSCNDHGAISVRCSCTGAKWHSLDKAMRMQRALQRSRP